MTCAAVVVRSSEDRGQTGVGEDVSGGPLQRRLGQNGPAHLSLNANAGQLLSHSQRIPGPKSPQQRQPESRFLFPVYIRRNKSLCVCVCVRVCWQVLVEKEWISFGHKFAAVSLYSWTPIRVRFL